MHVLFWWIKMWCTILYLLSKHLTWLAKWRTDTLNDFWFPVMLLPLLASTSSTKKARKHLIRLTLLYQHSSSFVHTMLSGLECSITSALLVPTQRNGWGRNRNPRPCEAVIFKNLKLPFKWTKLLEWQLADVTLSLMSCVRKSTKRDVALSH